MTATGEGCGTCLLSHHCNSTGQIFEYGSSNGSDWFFSPITLNTSLLSLLRFLSLLHPCPAWSGPPYICNEKRPFFYFLSHSLSVSLSLSLSSVITHCVFTAKNPHSVSIESDTPQKRASGFSSTTTQHFLSQLSWRSRRTCYPFRFTPIGSCFWVMGLLEIC